MRSINSTKKCRYILGQLYILSIGLKTILLWINDDYLTLHHKGAGIYLGNKYVHTWAINRCRYLTLCLKYDKNKS